MGRPRAFVRPANSVGGCCLHGRAGEVLGLIGPNGAGKTTLLERSSAFFPPPREWFSGTASLRHQHCA
ncbi:ATP-binding cassette domain-containing protein [Mesorhizobium sp. M0074]|uniref:ATP-binding cassette domain-containing protein n=1 Tax=Mesorhizobium sp. M0074 TaxID=2956869 RepID=UPI00333B0222